MDNTTQQTLLSVLENNTITQTQKICSSHILSQILSDTSTHSDLKIILQDENIRSNIYRSLDNFALKEIYSIVCIFFNSFFITSIDFEKSAHMLKYSYQQ